MLKSQIIDKLNLAGVEYDPSLTGKALMLQFPQVFQDTAEDTAEDDVEEEKVDAKTAVHFKIRNAAAKGNVSTRTFSLATHGENFLELANEFEKANTHRKVLNSDSKTNAQEILEVQKFNKQIQQPILSRHDE